MICHDVRDSLTVTVASPEKLVCEGIGNDLNPLIRVRPETPLEVQAVSIGEKTYLHRRVRTETKPVLPGDE